MAPILHLSMRPRRFVEIPVHHHDEMRGAFDPARTLVGQRVYPRRGLGEPKTVLAPCRGGILAGMSLPHGRVQGGRIVVQDVVDLLEGTEVRPIKEYAK